MTAAVPATIGQVAKFLGGPKVGEHVCNTGKKNVIERFLAMLIKEQIMDMRLRNLGRETGINRSVRRPLSKARRMLVGKDDVRGLLIPSVSKIGAPQRGGGIQTQHSWYAHPHVVA